MGLDEHVLEDGHWPLGCDGPSGDVHAPVQVFLQAGCLHVFLSLYFFLFFREYEKGAPLKGHAPHSIPGFGLSPRRRARAERAVPFPLAGRPASRTSPSAIGALSLELNRVFTPHRPASLPQDEKGRSGGLPVCAPPRPLPNEKAPGSSPGGCAGRCWRFTRVAWKWVYPHARRLEFRLVQAGPAWDGFSVPPVRFGEGFGGSCGPPRI